MKTSPEPRKPIKQHGQAVVGEPAVAQRQNDNPEFARNEGVKLGVPTSEDDPLWQLVGMVGDDYEGPTDVASHTHKYLADAYGDLHQK